MKNTILFVDDEENILLSLKRVFTDDRYKILTANKGEAGLAILKEHKDISVIIADMRMPEMDGVEFLKQAKLICPDAILIILSGFSDQDSLIKAINEGHIWKYIFKPWENKNLNLEIKNAIYLYEQIMEKKRLQGILERINIKVEKLNYVLVKKNKKLQENMKYHYPSKGKKLRYDTK